MGTSATLDWAGTKESAVRSYCRTWPVVFDRARGSWLYDEEDHAYLDFFCGAGALNYGHNNPVLKNPLADYLASDRVVHSLDMYTVAKREFLDTFDEVITGFSSPARAGPTRSRPR
jgi:diaminobutyrate-2-oxoglutarate transaminase